MKNPFLELLEDIVTDVKSIVQTCEDFVSEGKHKGLTDTVTKLDRNIAIMDQEIRLMVFRHGILHKQVTKLELRNSILCIPKSERKSFEQGDGLSLVVKDGYFEKIVRQDNVEKAYNCIKKMKEDVEFFTAFVEEALKEDIKQLKHDRAAEAKEIADKAKLLELKKRKLQGEEVDDEILALLHVKGRKKALGDRVKPYQPSKKKVKPVVKDNDDEEDCL